MAQKMKHTTIVLSPFLLLLSIGIALVKNDSSATAPGQSDGSFVHYEEFSSDYIKPRPIDVWLPPGYETNLDQSYPVVYMHDGQLVFKKKTSPYSSFWYKPFDWYVDGLFWEADIIMSRLIHQGKIRPAILVSIWFKKGNRAIEFMPQKPITDVPHPMWSIDDSQYVAGDIISDRYLKFLVEELKPFVDQNYRTSPNMENTFIMGSSMGGLISAYAISEYPDVFGAAACLSTDWTHGDGAEIKWYEKQWPKAGSHRLYFDFGTETWDAPFEPYQKKMDIVMRQHGYTEGVDWITKKFEGADHTPRAWRERLHFPLTFMLGY